MNAEEEKMRMIIEYLSDVFPPPYAIEAVPLNGRQVKSPKIENCGSCEMAGWPSPYQFAPHCCQIRTPPQTSSSIAA